MAVELNTNSPEVSSQQGSMADPSTVSDAIPFGVRVAAGWAWRLLALGVLVVASYRMITFFSAVTLPVAVAIMITALLTPAIVRLRKWGWPPYLASGVILLGTIVIVVAVFVGIGAQVANEAPGLVDRTMDGIAAMLDWLANGPLHIQATVIDEGWIEIKKWVANSQSQIARYLAIVGSGVGSFFAGLAVSLMSVFFFGAHGKEIFAGAANLLFPDSVREKMVSASGKGWFSLVAYMRAQVIVAAVDAAGIALAALLLDLPLVAALFALTFFSSFVPVIGAVTAGTVAVALALVTQGWVAALIMLGATILVMQAEGNLLAPLLLGKAVNLHPLAVLLGLVVGATLGGIVGALLIIPILAFLVAFGKALRENASPKPPEDTPQVESAEPIAESA